MLIENEISINDFVSAISEAIELVSPILNNHHKRTAYISYSIAQKMGIPNDTIKDIVLAAMLHDIGIASLKELLKVISLEAQDTYLNQHAQRGYELLKGFTPLAKAAELIKYHHEEYQKSKTHIPMGSYIIHLADRVAIAYDEQREVLGQIPEVLAKIQQNREVFHPDVFTALNRLAKKEYFVLESFYPSFSRGMLKKMRFPQEVITLEALKDFAKIIAQVIDFRSRFTATHSSGVAAVALELSMISEFSERECKQMEIAGFLHDLGKLAVPNGILEKNGALDETEISFIRKHPYHTYNILSKIQGLEHIAAWAAYHHERQDGNGYPFHVKGRDFPRLARIMTVADILTALTEDRPYRLGMSEEMVLDVLADMAESGGIDKNIVELAKKNFSRINEKRIKAQKEARKEYDNFHHPDTPVIP